jgi:hypothetical protein
MSETPDSGAPGSLIPEQLPPLGGVEDEALRARPEVAGELRRAQEAWLERRGVLEGTPHLVMTRREFELLRDVGLGDGGDTTSFLIDKTRKNYGIPDGAQYASVDIVPNDAGLPHVTHLVAVGEEDFGTAIDEGRVEEPEGVPSITMTEREFGLFGIVGMDGITTPHLVEHARDLCGIPQDDQYAPQYALIDIESDDPTLPSEPLLVDVSEVDFGTTIDADSDDKYFQNPGSGSGSPPTPESGGGAYITVDISEAFDRSWQGLQAFATELMRGRMANPLSERQFWLRAGGVASGQRDAFVWENGRPLASAIELTIAFPSQYASVCAVVGERQDPINGKPGMAQIKDPTVILTVEGEDLRRLQAVYRDLYNQPDFALTDAQRRHRDELFNNYLVSLTSEATRRNQAREVDEAARRSSVRRPQLRAREIPRSDK